MNTRPTISSGPRFSVIPAAAITDQSIEPRALQVLCLLGRHTDRAGWCSRSQVRMARELGCGRSTVQRALDQLYDAGYVQRRRAAGDADEGKQPSASFRYRVVLDVDDGGDYDGDDGADAEAASSEIASHAGDACDDGDQSLGADEGGAHQRAPGCPPMVGTRAHTCTGTKERPLVTTPIERERDARAREATAKNIAAFEARWPAASASDRNRVAYAMEGLSAADQQAALDGIAPFLAELKRLRRSTVPAGQTYLEQRRWELLPKPERGGADVPTTFAPASREGRALATLHRIGRSDEFYFKAVCRQGVVCWSRAIDAQVLTLADAAPREQWVELSYQQAGAWEAFLQAQLKLKSRRRLREGDLAPWPWPPKRDGTLSEVGEGSGAGEREEA